MPGKCFRGLVTLMYVTSSVLPLAAQQGPTQPPLTPVPVQPAPTEPNQAPPGQGQPPPSQLPRRAPIVPQRPPSAAQQVPGTPGASDGSVPQGVPAPAPAPAPTPIPPERRMLPPPSTAGGMVSLNFNRADLVEIIHILAQHLRLTYTIDPEVKGIVTIHSAEPLRPEDLLPIFHQVLRMNNAVAVRTGNIYRITTIKDAKGLVRPLAQGREDSFALQVVPVRFFSAAEMKKLLTPFLTPGGELVDYPRGNFLVIIDLPSNIQRLVEIADMIDVQVFAGTRMEIYQPKVASAEELATEMTKVMQYYAASAPQQENFASQFVPLPRINQLLVISHSEAAWTYAKRWLERVDVAGEGPGRRIFIYPVENGKATELADVLTQALGQPMTGRRDTSRTLQDLHRSTPGGFGQFDSGSRSLSPSYGRSGFQQQTQPLGGAFATVPAPAPTQAPPAAPTPGLPPGLPSVPGAPRPTTPAAPGAKPEEQLRIVPDPGTNSLIIYGTVQEFQNIKNILKDLDIIPRQVLMDVMVAEVSLTGSESFGVEYELFRKYNPSIFGQTFDSQGAVRSGIFNQATRPATENSPFAQFLNGISGVAGRGNTIRAFISALATDNRAKILSSPSVLATDNRPARIQVGREIPVLSSQSQSVVGDSPIVNSVQYRNTGVILTIIPQVNSQGLVHLQVKQEVSDVGAPSFGNTNSPSFTTRDAETTAVVQDGDTLAIGGIISDTTRRDRSGVPYLMDLPVLGRLFGTTNDTTDRTELVMLITPHVVRNRDEAQQVTEGFKEKIYGVRNELERFWMEQERLKSRRQQPAMPPAEIPAVPGPRENLPIPTPNTSSIPRGMPGPALPQHAPQNPAPPQPSISLDKRGRKNASAMERAGATAISDRPADVAVVTELTNRNPALPWPPPVPHSAADLVTSSDPMQVAQGIQSEGIASALSVRSIDAVAQFERPAP
ncbi:MAG TPA: type II secretion system secretin GspD, partial [Candidatus Binatia bacterium]|nr:type II secretion system secretin GspD [Candidatus Binatia bacterium]